MRTKELGLRPTKGTVALCSKMCRPILFLVIILSCVVEKAILTPRFVSARPRFHDLIDNLVATTDEVIIAFSRNISASSGAQSAQQRMFPVTLAWSVSQRVNRGINIKAAIEYVISLLLVSLFSVLIGRQRRAKQ